MSVNKVAFNTVITYAKAVITSLISLYSTRIILSALGADDYGLYNVIGGVIGMLSFLNAAMTTSTQRFISFNLGAGKIGKVKKIFANSIIIHLLIGLLVVVGIEVLGVYLIDNQLNINFERLNVARYILHFVVVSMFITIISVPYDSVINAYENMTFLAIVSIFEAILKLAIAISLPFFAEDKLVLFGFLTMISAILIRIIKRVYARKKYEECKVNYIDEFDKLQSKELISFAGWNLFGSLCAIGRNQGVAVILNLFFSTVVNAAYGIANQINSQLMFFSSTMLSAIRPQIMKSEGAKDRTRMIRLALTANKFSFYIFTFFALPVFFKLPYLLGLWLEDVPDYTVDFCRLIIILTFLIQLNSGLMTAIQAIGRIKVYQIVAGSIQLLTIPIGYVILKKGYPPYTIIKVAIVLEILATIFRISYFNYLTKFPVLEYLKDVYFKTVSSLFIVSLLLLYVEDLFRDNILGFLSLILCSSLSYSLVIILIGLTKYDKKMILKLFESIKTKIKK